MDRLANPAAELRLRLIYQGDRSWLVTELDGAPLPIASRESQVASSATTK